MFSSGINKVILLGRVDGKPEIRQIGKEKMFCITLITSEQFKRNGEESVHHEHHNVTINIKMVKAGNIKNGKILYIQGRLRTQQSLDENSVRRYNTYVNAYAVEHMDVKLMVVA